MSTYLSYSEQWLKEHNGLFTAKEILQQPELWCELIDIIDENKKYLFDFLNPIFSIDNLQIILTGAGSSAFVGDAAVPILNSQTDLDVKSIATTDLVSAPDLYLDAERPTLLISYARSGNSPESVAAVNIVDQCVKQTFHLAITCHQEGALAKLMAAKRNAFSLLMPALSHDSSFAMTSSFSCMLMSTFIVLKEIMQSDWKEKVQEISEICRNKFTDWNNEIKYLANQNYERVIILGSGPFLGLSREGALKSLELSAGKLTSTFDSSLGFRHGPKFTLNNKSIVIQMISNNNYTKLYDWDLFKEIEKDNQSMIHIALHAGENNNNTYGMNCNELTDVWLCFPYLLFCQWLAFEKSLNVGLGPDNPCPSGEVNRVVQGVIIHPYQSGICQ